MKPSSFLHAAGAFLLVASFVSADPADAASRRVVKTDGQGDTTTVGGAAVRGPNGASAVRAGTTTVDADGSAAHRSGFAAQGAKGSVQSQGSATRAVGGGVTQNRTTTATSTATGNSATTTTSSNNGTGRTRTTSCFDASGATIPCPSKP